MESSDIEKALLKQDSPFSRFVKDINRCTRSIVLIDFVINSVNIASVATEILTLKSSLKILMFPMVHLVLILGYVILLGWFSNEIMVQNSAIGDTLYMTEWYNEDVRIQKMYVILLRQSQEPLTISIGHFAPMTLDTVLKTLQTAYSYMMLMQNYK